jgi:hypothetical protein
MLLHKHGIIINIKSYQNIHILTLPYKLIDKLQI